LLGFKDLKSVKGIPYSRSEIRRKEQAGTFPMHVTLGDGNGACIAWPENEVDDWIVSRMAARATP
jgi:predicted DNA-binding transcriptional regulator AlpA